MKIEFTASGSAAEEALRDELGEYIALHVTAAALAVNQQKDIMEQVGRAVGEVAAFAPLARCTLDEDRDLQNGEWVLKVEIEEQYEDRAHGILGDTWEFNGLTIVVDINPQKKG